VSDALIVAAARTAIGRAFKGSLITARPDDLGACVVRAVLERVPELDPRDVDDVIFGAANQSGEQSMNLARLVGLLGGLPDSVPATTVNRFCASSLQAIRMADHAIRAGEGDVFVCGGVESISRTRGRGFDPGLDQHPRFTDASRPDFIDHVYIAMGETAELVADRFHVGRADMDWYAKISQDRAMTAQRDGTFAREIVPYRLDDGTVVSNDDGPRPTTLEGLAQLKPVFREDGRVTAGNACQLSDGAAAVLVMSDRKAAALGVKPLARVIASTVSGLAPEIMGVGPIVAVRKLLTRTKMSIADVDVVELNEAFAAQVLPVCQELGIDIDRQLNPHGGSIALGHPYGMTGARIMTALINDLTALDRTIGLETMCIGGGQGMAMLIERLR
jgi:acetyl-CoA C-acetyltransferase